MKKVTTLESIANIIGATGFKQYAKDYGNSRVNLDGDVVDVINLLESYRDDEKLIDHFNCFKREMTDKYASSSVPFYKTDAFNEQNQQEINEFGYIASM
ncbi:hypothetical protein BN938_1811 [Mucinivorans hirudinis]|uniref:Uncharacterized protein n=1 Tax=Mucinivorans hirudinis TaxID=1433126 RepID=A0A060R8M5_9BACT|nr:hypothetical protein BN938_1811 [Mucinivorans hirudinis]